MNHCQISKRYLNYFYVLMKLYCRTPTLTRSTPVVSRNTKWEILL